MSSRNDETQAMGAALAFIGIGIFFAMLIMFALAAVLAIVFTVVAFCAWRTPIKFLGETIYPHEAHAFVKRGVIGIFALPIFAALAEIVLNFRTPAEVWPYIFFAGYVIGSVGVEYAMHEAKQAAPEPFYPFDSIPPAIPDSPPLRESPRSPFEFASWDDEDRRP